MRLYARARARFFYRSATAELTFVKEGDKVVGLVIHSNGKKIPPQKIK